ncbi:MAG: hypothetical protein ACK54F_12705 [Planctomycetia bacterium]|jgi:hypothetical protein
MTTIDTYGGFDAFTPDDAAVYDNCTAAEGPAGSVALTDELPWESSRSS